MTLLSVESVTRKHAFGGSGELLLDHVSFTLERGEHVAIIGQRRSGRTTLLRIAAGLEAPDSGVVRFEGRPLLERDEPVVGRGMSLAHKGFRSGHEISVLVHITLAAHVLAVPRAVARTRAQDALERVNATNLGRLAPTDLKGEDLIRVAIARALVSQPKLVLIDEPTDGVSWSERDAILHLIRSLRDDDIAALFTVTDMSELRGADRSLSLHGGELVGHLDPSPGVADASPFDRRASSA